MPKPNKGGIGVIRGNKRDNFLQGTDDADNIEGRGGNDTMVGGLGDDSIDGGDGLDTVILNGLRDDYSVTVIDATTVEITGPDGTDTITNVETFVFDDLTQSFAEVILPREANLTASGITVNATTLVEGTSLAVDWTVASNGVIDAGTTTTRLVIASAPDLAAAIEVFGSLETGVLATGSEASYGGTLDTTGFAPGTYYVAAVADSGDALSESDETDNVTEWVAITIEAQSFNLAATNLAVSDTVITPTQDSAITWDVTADGNAPTGATYTSLVIATAPDLASAFTIDQIYTAPLAPGETASQYTIIDWSTLAPGNYWVAAFADGTEALAETDETDNLTGWVEIMVEGEEFNLALTDVALNPSSDFDLSSEWDGTIYDYDPSNLPGALLDVSVTIQNGGNTGTGAFELRTYLSADGVLGPDDELLTWGSDPTSPSSTYDGYVWPGEDVTIDLQYAVSEQLDSGTYQLITELIALDGLPEDDSDNVFVSDPFDLIGGYSRGTDGNDVFAGTTADDTIEGYAGDDIMVYSTGSDFFDAGDGYDRADYSAVAGSIQVSIMQDAVLVDGIYFDIADYFVDVFPAGWDPYGQDPYATVEYQFLRDVESFAGTEGDDAFYVSGTTAVEISAGGGADQVLTGLGDDIIDTGSGNDLMAGMAGDDLIFTGEGMDEVFVLREADGTGGTTGHGNDIVSDFDPYMDLLLIEWDSSANGAWDPLGSVIQTSEGALVQYADDSSVLLLGVDAALIDSSNLISIEPGDGMFDYLA